MSPASLCGLEHGKHGVVDIQFQNLIALYAFAAGLLDSTFSISMDSGPSALRHTGGDPLQAGRDLDLFHLAVQCVLHGIEQVLVLSGSVLGGLFSSSVSRPRSPLLTFLNSTVPSLPSASLAGIGAQDLQAELIHILGQQQDVIAPYP